MALFVYLPQYFLLINNQPCSLIYDSAIHKGHTGRESVSIRIFTVSVLNVEIFRQVIHQNLVIVV
jgi:hypothetical protein